MCGEGVTDMQTELTLSELEVQQAELLPERETLFFDFNYANVLASNAAYAVNAATILSAANANAYQKIIVSQH
jgi:hypothetical protein